MTSYELLTRMHSLIARTDITKKYYARTATGEYTTPWDPAASAFCIRGACIFVHLESEKILEDEEEPRDPLSNHDKNDAYNALFAILGVTDKGQLTAWTDAPERTKQEVLDVLELAAENEKKRLDMA